MDPTPEPTPCRGLSPDGPGCPTPTPAGPGIVQPDGGDTGSGVSGVLGSALDVLLGRRR